MGSRLPGADAQILTGSAWVLQGQDVGDVCPWPTGTNAPPSLPGESQPGVGAPPSCLGLPFHPCLGFGGGILTPYPGFGEVYSPFALLLCFFSPAARTPGAQLLRPVPPGLCAPALLSTCWGFFPPFPLISHQFHFPLLLPSPASSQPLRCLSLPALRSLSVPITVINTVKGLSVASISRAPAEPRVSPQNRPQPSAVPFRSGCAEKMFPTEGPVEGFALNRRGCGTGRPDGLLQPPGRSVG